MLFAGPLGEPGEFLHGYLAPLWVAQLSDAHFWEVIFFFFLEQSQFLEPKTEKKKLAKELNHLSHPDRGNPMPAVLRTDPGTSECTGLLNWGSWGLSSCPLTCQWLTVQPVRGQPRPGSQCQLMPSAGHKTARRPREKAYALSPPFTWHLEGTYAGIWADLTTLSPTWKLLIKRDGSRRWNVCT